MNTISKFIVTIILVQCGICWSQTMQLDTHKPNQCPDKKFATLMNGNGIVTDTSPFRRNPVIPNYHSIGRHSYASGYDVTGVRAGITVITGETAARLKERFDAEPLITQFGWHFENRFYSSDDGFVGVFEYVPLVGGLEQHLFIPSFNWLAGIRAHGGTEFGFGPHFSIGGIGYVFAAGITKQYGNLNIPLNFATVFSKNGLRLSFLVGFNAFHRRGTSLD